MMFHLEGTRNERAIVIIASYVIGFVSAYIWFGATVSLAPTHSQLADHGTQPDAFTVAKADKSVDFSSVTYEEGLLEYHGRDNSAVLSMASFRTSQDSKEYLEASGGQGVHEDITSFSLSPDGRFVFFCENYGGDGCSGYIYDVADETIRPVRTDDGVVTISERDAQLASFTASGLLVGDSRSASADTPWLLTR